MEKYGKALNKTDHMTRQIETDVRNMQTIYGGMPVPWDSFSPIYKQALSTYRMISAVRKLQLPYSHPDPLSDSGNRVNLEMMLADSPFIDDSNYLLQPEDDYSMELNRLRIIGSIYDMIFRNLSITAAAARLRCSYMEEDAEYASVSSGRVSEFLSGILAIQNEVLNGKIILVEGRPQEYLRNAKLNEIISSITLVIDAFYKQSNIELEVILSDKDIEVEGNPRDIKQALMNILMAKKYALRQTDKGKVTLGSGVYGNYAVIYITDNGPKIPHEDANFIFKVAENAAAKTWTHDRALARKMILLSYGKVLVRNVEEGGVEEQIILPGISS